MQRKIFAVFDSVSLEIFGPLFLLPNEAAARRLFQDAVFGQGSQLASHPQDYDLYCVGSFDTETGELSQDPGQRFTASAPLLTGADLVREVSRQRERERDAQVDLEDEISGPTLREVSNG